MPDKKIKTSIYIIRYGNINPEYIGFAIGSEKKIIKKLDKLNRSSLMNTYYLEVLTHGLFPREIVSVMKKAKHQLKKGEDIINYIGHVCNYIDDKVRTKIRKLSDMSLLKVCELTKEFAHLNNFFENLSNYLKYELGNNGYNNLRNISSYNFKDDSNLKIAPDYENQ